MLWLKRSAAAFAIVSVALLLAPLGGHPATSPAPFAVGEKLTYAVSWSVFDAGEVTATLQRNPDGHKSAGEIVAAARSQGFVSMLYNLDDEYRSRLDLDTMCSSGISKRVVENHRRKQTEIVFDLFRKVAVLDERNLAKASEAPKHGEHPVPACVQDVVSAFYFLRTQPLSVGERIAVPVNDGGKTTDVSVEVQARERIDTPLGRRYAFRLEPTVFGNLYQRKGRMLIWFSDDAERLPLRIKAMISVGTIVGTLKSVDWTAGIGAPNAGAASSVMGFRSLDPPAEASPLDAVPAAESQNPD